MPNDTLKTKADDAAGSVVCHQAAMDQGLVHGTCMWMHGLNTSILPGLFKKKSTGLFLNRFDSHISVNSLVSNSINNSIVRNKLQNLQEA